MARLRIRPPAELKPREGDEELSVHQLKQIALFKDVNLERLELEGFPGTLVLRHYRKGDIICRQNDPGYTAFYILTTKDLLELRQSQLAAASGDAVRTRHLETEIAALKMEAEREGQPAASVVKESTGRRPRKPDKAAATPRTVMHAGELFGEMSCLYRMPRTATVVAERDCYMLELLRNILDKMYGNKKFKEQVDAAYRKRRLGFDLRSLPVFQDLDARLLEALRDRAELEEFEPGDLICDEHDRADSMYIIRSGFIKVMKDASSLLHESAVVDWPGLGKALHAGGQEPAGPGRKVWDLLPPPVQAALGRTEVFTDEDKKLILFALNELIKQPKLYMQVDGKALPETAALEAQAKKLSGNPAKWSQHQDIRRLNRRLLSLLYPGLVPANPGTPRILAYRSANDPLIGEIGLIFDEPRSATCIAYDHYGEGKLINGRVELVRISRELFDEIRTSSPHVQQRIEQVAEERLRYTRQRLSLPAWREDTPAALSAKFNDLGLIQGQKLMLIDLDRCTRCDKCVEACVTTHSPPWWSGLPLLRNLVTGPTDGRSRLFLEGPRFQVNVAGEVKNYLVPSTCRMCQDPVCLVGCPVGSIHKGENGQIVIENWCIGCSRCANQCPYGSIQMHAVGVIPRGVDDWRSRRGNGTWHPERTPITSTRELRERYAGDGVIRFRYRFTLSEEMLQKSKSFQLHLQTAASDPRTRLNGRKVILAAVKGQGPGGMKWTHEAMLTREGAPPVEGLAPGESAPQPLLKRGRNVLTVRVKPTIAENEVLCDLGLYAVSQPVVPPGVAGEVNQEVVMNTAVVCDLCSSQFGQRPACVNACPHEAALRVDAATFFPLH